MWMLSALVGPCVGSIFTGKRPVLMISGAVHLYFHFLQNRYILLNKKRQKRKTRQEHAFLKKDSGDPEVPRTLGLPPGPGGGPGTPNSVICFAFCF